MLKFKVGDKVKIRADAIHINDVLKKRIFSILQVSNPDDNLEGYDYKLAVQEFPDGVYCFETEIDLISHFSSWEDFLERVE